MSMILLLFSTTELTLYIQFHNYFNSEYHCLKFTYEVEINTSLPFLGVLVTKNDNNYQLGIYHKPTSTGLFTNFNTFSPISHKMAAVRSLCYRVIYICSSFESIISEFNSITKQLQATVIQHHYYAN